MGSSDFMSGLAGIAFLGSGLADLIRGRIPNAASYGLWAFGLILALWQGTGVGALIGSLLAGGVFFLAWLGRAAGGGDVKLMAAAGAWAGWPGALDVLVYVTVLGAAWAVGLWIWGRARQGKGWRGRVPYGMAIGLGTAAVLWSRYS